MKSHNRICHKVSQFNIFALSDDVGVLSAQQPTNMREEKSPFGVMGIGISFGIFMMSPVISTPFIDVILKINASIH